MDEGHMLCSIQTDICILQPQESELQFIFYFIILTESKICVSSLELDS